MNLHSCSAECGVRSAEPASPKPRRGFAKAGRRRVRSAGARFVVRVFASTVVLAAAACGGGSPTAPGPPAGGGTPATSTFAGTVAAYAITSHPHTVTRAGTLTVTLTWTAQADLDLYVTTSTCTGYPPDACVILARSTASTGQREEVVLPVAANAALTLWVDNFSPNTSAPYGLTAILR